MENTQHLIDSLSPVKLETKEEIRRENKEKFLKASGYTEGDVMVDKEGREYVIALNENGNPGEDMYEVVQERVYLNEIL